MVVALAGVESGREEFKEQKSLLDDLLNITGWNRSEYENGIWIDIPNVLGYVYHGLHGSISLNTNQLDLAVNLSRVKIHGLYTKDPLQVWESRNLMGWAKSLGGSRRDGWNYLAGAFDRWKWLSLIFEDNSEYRTSLVAYYMVLNVHELAVLIASGQENRLSDSYSQNFPFFYNVPLFFMSEEQYIYQRACSLLLRDPDAVAELWTRLNVTHEQMKNSWENWIRLFEDWLENVNMSAPISDVYHYNIIHHQNFFNVLKP